MLAPKARLAVPPQRTTETIGAAGVRDVGRAAVGARQVAPRESAAIAGPIRIARTGVVDARAVVRAVGDRGAKRDARGQDKTRVAMAVPVDAIAAVVAVCADDAGGSECLLGRQAQFSLVSTRISLNK